MEGEGATMVLPPHNFSWTLSNASGYLLVDHKCELKGNLLVIFYGGNGVGRKLVNLSKKQFIESIFIALVDAGL